MENKKEIIRLFHTIKEQGFVRSMRANNTGIGKTFEELIGVAENNIDAPDLLGFEIKSHREHAESYVTLFTRKPSFPLKANSYLVTNYGMVDPETGLLRLHTSMFANRDNSFFDTYSFRLINSSAERKIYLQIKTLATGHTDIAVGYTYDDIENSLTKKLKKLFYVEAETRQDDVEYFHFHTAEIYENPTLERFLQMLDEGLIMFDIRIGSYKSGKYKGKPHDHGSGFRIKAEKLKDLYATHEIVK